MYLEGCRYNLGLKYILKGKLHLVSVARESFKTRHNIYEACAKQDE